MKACLSAALLLVVFALASPVPVGARERGVRPEPYGRYFVRAESVQKTLIPPLQSAPEGAAYLERVQQRVWQQGPYGAGLSESLLDAANYFQGRGDSEQAEALLRRSVHLTRINDGLNSMLQLPMLDSLLDNYSDSGDWEAADEIQSWRLHLRRQNYQPDQSEYIQASVEYANWKCKLWLLDPTPDEPDRLYRIWGLLKALVPEEDEAPLAMAELKSVIYTQLRLLYVISVSDFGMDLETERQLGRSFSSDQAQPDIGRSQIQQLQKSAYTRGMSQLKLLLAGLDEDDDEIARAEVQRQLADWHLWNSNRKRAAEAYGLAWQLLAADASGHYRQDWFAEPVELPADEILYVPAAADAALSDTVRIRARFSVSEQGKPRDIETLLEAGEEQEGSYRLRRLLKKTRFRPRMEAGELVATEQVLREYELEY